MARRVFFSFHFEGDIWRANQVRMANVVAGPDRAGFFDHSEYEDAQRKGEEAIRRMILRHLDGTSVTVVLIGRETADRPWVQFEVEQSITRNNGLLGIYINRLKNQKGQASFVRGSKPTVPSRVSFPAYDWDQDVARFRRAIEAAGKRSDALRTPSQPWWLL